MQPSLQPHPQTGPKSAAGKDVSSQNATTHGGTSLRLVVAGERREDFDALLNGLVAEFAPETANDRTVVEDAALARWFLWRKQRVYNAIESEVYAVEPDPAKWSEADHKRLALADRYKTTAERALRRALVNVEGLRKNFIRQDDRIVAGQRWAAAHVLKERRVEVQEARLKLAQNREARRAAKDSPQAPRRSGHFVSQKTSFLRLGSEIEPPVPSSVDSPNRGRGYAIP